jgi:hypothetical protein
VNQRFQSEQCWWADYIEVAGIKKILERLNQAIEVIYKPKKAGKITDIGTLF